MDTAAHPQLSWIIDWTTQYPIMTSVFIFSIAMLESLVLVGIPVPGAALIIAFGAMISLGYLDFTSTMLLCIAGAITGDGISFWIGYRYQQQLKNIWPFKHFKSHFVRGESFFQKHGGKSIVFGRFVGPVRAVIPTIAGMMGMSPLRFSIINILSAIAWAPAYLLPGMVFGASMEMAAEVAIRLVVLLMMIAVLLLVIRWLIRKTLAYLQPRAEIINSNSIKWARRHKRLGPIVESLIDPRHPESPALFFFAILLIAAGLTFFFILNTIGAQISQLDLRVYEFMHSLRTPWMDQIMTGITMMGDTLVITAMTVILLVWLLYKRNFPAAIHWLAAILFGTILTRVLKVSLQIPRPDPNLFPGSGHYSFPSAHSTMSMLLYGFLAIIICREIQSKWRNHIYAAAAILISMIAISRLYLGAHWLSDVMGGLSLGLAWITLLGIAYRRHLSPALVTRPLIIVSMLAFVFSNALNWQLNFEREQDRYQESSTVSRQHLGHWLDREWQTLPAFRNDLANTTRYPFNLQWNGSIQSIKKILGSHGWKATIKPDLKTSMKWLSSTTPINERAILSQVHKGAHESMAYSYFEPSSGQMWIIRLWPSKDITNDQPIWLGQLTPMKIKSFLNLFHYPITVREFTQPLELLESQINQQIIKTVYRKNATSAGHWDGKLLLIRSQETPTGTLITDPPEH